MPALAPVGMGTTGAMAGACGDHGDGLLILVNGMVALAVALVPAIYILARRRIALRTRMVYVLGLLAVNLLSVGVLSLVVSEGGDELVSPLPWFLALLPGFGLAVLFRNEPARPRR